MLGFHDADSARSKFTILRNQYIREKNKVKKKPSGSATKQHKKWKFFDELNFLDEVGE